MTGHRRIAGWPISKVLLVSLGIPVLLCGAVLLEATVGPISLLANVLRTARLRSRLPEAAALWESSGISDYDVDVRANIPFCWYDVGLQVRGGELISVVERETVPWRDLRMCQVHMDYSALRIPEFFDRVERDLRTLDVLETQLQVEFNAESGYITYFSSNCSYRGARSIGDCFTEYRFTNFQQVP